MVSGTGSWFKQAQAIAKIGGIDRGDIGHNASGLCCPMGDPLRIPGGMSAPCAVTACSGP